MTLAAVWRKKTRLVGLVLGGRAISEVVVWFIVAGLVWLVITGLTDCLICLEHLPLK
jgi:hypothetical protein